MKPDICQSFKDAGFIFREVDKTLEKYKRALEICKNEWTIQQTLEELSTSSQIQDSSQDS